MKPLTDNQKLEIACEVADGKLLVAGKLVNEYLGYTMDIVSRTKVALKIYRELGGERKFELLEESLNNTEL